MPKPISDKPNYKRHDDDEWFDEIRIVTVPRYKTSGMSGDEWRFSANVQLLRKGHVLFERSFSKIHYAIDFLPAIQHEYADMGCGSQDVEGNEIDFNRYCFNPGCREDGVVEYRLIDQFHRPYGDKMPKRDYLGENHRRFCEAHAKRGDCGLEDADSNYILISAPPGWEGNADLGAQQAESPSAFAGTITSLDELPAAIQEIRNEHERKTSEGTGSK
jgi:hypothetical protein